MITVKEFLDAGFNFEIGGDAMENDSYEGKWSSGDEVHYDRAPEDYTDWFVKECAWRTNTGTQPVGDACRVEVELRNGSAAFRDAGELSWGVETRNNQGEIIKWRPHLPSLEKSCNKQCLNDPKPLGQMPRCEECKRLATEMTERDLPDFDDCDVERVLAESDEWVNGDECVIDGYGGVWQFGCDVPNSDLVIVFRIKSSSHMTIPKDRMLPLTQEQKSAKDRYEGISEMRSIASTGSIHDDHDVKWAIEKLYDAGYRKGDHNEKQ